MSGLDPLAMDPFADAATATALTTRDAPPEGFDFPAAGLGGAVLPGFGFGFASAEDVASAEVFL